MLGICRREYTINETSIGHFLWKYCIYNKIKKNQIAFTEKLHRPTEKE